MSVIWHDLECGNYAEDIPLWRALTAEYGDPVLDIGAGTGRITLELARAGHAVTALDRDSELLAELARRADGLEVQIVAADAREFDLGRRFALCVVPMQTIQLLGGADGRARFLRCAQAHLVQGGALAIAIADTLDLYEGLDGGPYPLPDVCERDGVVYSSQPTAVRADRDVFVLERRRETIRANGSRSSEEDVIHLDRLTSAQLEREAADAGLRAGATKTIPATPDYVGSEVIILHA